MFYTLYQQRLFCSLCKYEMKEKHTANLERHVRSKHLAGYAAIMLMQFDTEIITK